MKELTTLDLTLCVLMISIFLTQLVFLAFVIKFKRKINRLPYDSKEEEEVRTELFQIQKKFTPIFLTQMILAIVILLIH